MIYAPSVGWAVCQYYAAALQLKRELGREPSAAEVRSHLGWPEILGRVTVEYLNPSGGGTRVSFPDTDYELAFSSRDPKTEGWEVTLMKKQPKVEVPTA